MGKFKKGTLVIYKVRDLVVEGIVLRAHRDGSSTVEARHFLDNEGNIDGAYLGYRYRMADTDLQVAA